MVLDPLGRFVAPAYNQAAALRVAVIAKHIPNLALGPTADALLLVLQSTESSPVISQTMNVQNVTSKVGCIRGCTAGIMDQP